MLQLDAFVPKGKAWMVKKMTIGIAWTGVSRNEPVFEAWIVDPKGARLHRNGKDKRRISSRTGRCPIISLRSIFANNTAHNHPQSIALVKPLHHRFRLIESTVNDQEAFPRLPHTANFKAQGNEVTVLRTRLSFRD